jgi:hypothetical protein
MCKNISGTRHDFGADSADEAANMLVFLVNIERLHFNTIIDSAATPMR